jgi:hypothetical protein
VRPSHRDDQEAATQDCPEANRECPRLIVAHIRENRWLVGGPRVVVLAVRNCGLRTACVMSSC